MREDVIRDGAPAVHRVQGVQELVEPVAPAVPTHSVCRALSYRLLTAPVAASTRSRKSGVSQDTHPARAKQRRRRVRAAAPPRGTTSAQRRHLPCNEQNAVALHLAWHATGPPRRRLRLRHADASAGLRRRAARHNVPRPRLLIVDTQHGAASRPATHSHLAAGLPAARVQQLVRAPHCLVCEGALTAPLVPGLLAVPARTRCPPRPRCARRRAVPAPRGVYRRSREARPCAAGRGQRVPSLGGFQTRLRAPHQRRLQGRRRRPVFPLHPRSPRTTGNRFPAWSST